MVIRKIGIIGAGNMGSGIAQKIAQEGIEVVMVDMEERFVERGMANIRETLAEAVRRRIFTEEKTDEILSRITGTTDLGEVRDADIVIEAIFEDFDVKKDLFRRLDRLCEEKTILASNTSSYSITDLAEAVQRKDRFLGLHFFYHPAKNRLLEVIPGKCTGEAAVRLGNSFSNVIGKTGINVADAPGFAVNRFFVPWLNEATRLHGEGISIPTIDETAKRVFKIGMGPFLLMNVTGVPIAYHSTVGLGGKLGDFYGPSECLGRQFEKGEEWDLSGEVQPEHEKKVEERLLGAVFLVACQLVQENIASVEDTDRGAKIGLRWRLGPFEMMNRAGIARSHEIVADFAGLYSLPVPAMLEELSASGKEWEFRFVDLDVRGKVARITINRPEAMNALNEDVVRQLDEQFGRAEAAPDVETIVLEGAGKAFVAGADIQYFIRKIDEGRIDEIVSFTRYGHEVLKRIDDSEKLVIARLDGLALGGGAEMALAADTIVATEKGTMGFPETGIGIYPGLGGTQRTTRYIGRELTKYMVYTGRTLDAATARDMGLVEYVIPSAEIDTRLPELIESGNILTKKSRDRGELPEHVARLKKYFENANLPKLLSKSDELDETGRKLAKTIGFKAPIAVRLAGKLIDEGAGVPLADGIEMELAHLPEIFATKDAYEGLSSVINRKRAVFKGE